MIPSMRSKAQRMKLVIFDVDGTLIDSQAHILSAMTAAYEAVSRPLPAREMVLSIVGLSLEQAMRSLCPEASQVEIALMVTRYKERFQEMRLAGHVSPLYPGMLDLLQKLDARKDVILAIATSKSRRGLMAILQEHALGPYFMSLQCADDHPSKPHPSMILTALSETGALAADSVMIGDTSYDCEMARSAGVKAIGVTWGYHSVEKLTAADIIADDAERLAAAIDQGLSPKEMS